MFKRYFIDRIAGRFGIPTSAMAYWHAFNRVGKQVSLGLPEVLVSLGAHNLLRGLLTRFVIPVNLDWVWPYWVNQQYDPRSKSFMPRGFQLASLNMTHRNWTAIGNVNSVQEAIVDPRGLLVPRLHGWSIDVWLAKDGQLYAPSQLSAVSQHLRQDLPIVVTTFQADSWQVTLEAFIEKTNDEEYIYQQVRVVNLGNSAETADLLISLRPCNTEGISLISNILYSEQSFYVNSQWALYLDPAPQAVRCHNYEVGDVSLAIGQPEEEDSKAACEIGLCTAYARYPITLEPRGQLSVNAFVAINDRREKPEKLEIAYDHVLTKSIAKWRDRLDNRGLRLHLPDARWEAAFNANRAHLLVFHDGDSITPGPFSYHFFWYRDAAYMINALDKLGFAEEAEMVLQSYPDRQKRLGHFSSQKGEWDTNGQAIWTLVEHYLLHGDKDFLQKVYAAIRRAALWIEHHLPSSADPLYDGLHASGLSAEHFGANDVYYWDDFWSLGGLKAARQAAECLGQTKDAQRFQKTATKLANSLEVSLQAVAQRLGRRLIPISPSPSRRMDSAAVGSLVCVYPLELYSIEDERVRNTLNYLWDKCVIDNGFFHDVIHSGYGTYLTAHIAQCFARARDIRAIRMLEWLLDKATDTYTWPEAIHPNEFGGNMGDGHHGWAAADFVLLMRNLLIMEQGEDLWLLSGAPEEWFKVGKKIAIHNAPTKFGRVDFTVTIHRHQQAELVWDCNLHIVPRHIKLFLPPDKITSVVYQQKEYKVNGEWLDLVDVGCGGRI